MQIGKIGDLVSFAMIVAPLFGRRNFPVLLLVPSINIPKIWCDFSISSAWLKALKSFSPLLIHIAPNFFKKKEKIGFLKSSAFAKK